MFLERSLKQFELQQNLFQPQNTSHDGTPANTSARNVSFPKKNAAKIIHRVKPCVKRARVSREKESRLTTHANIMQRAHYEGVHREYDYEYGEFSHTHTDEKRVGERERKRERVYKLSLISRLCVMMKEQVNRAVFEHRVHTRTHAHKHTCSMLVYIACNVECKLDGSL